jgi:hypothetical protein
MNFRNLLGLARSPRGGQFFDLDVAGIRIKSVEPLGNWLTPGVTKVGRLSFRGVFEGKKVKVYSPHSAAQVELRRAVETLSLSSFAFPELVASDDQFVVEEWITGEGLKQASNSHTCRMIDELHSATGQLDGQWREDPSFCYLEDYLINRLARWQGVSQISAFCKLWKSRLEGVGGVLDTKLCHPDLTLRNTVTCKKTGKAYVVDNELLGVGCGWILDWHNAGVPDAAFENEDFTREIRDFIDLSWKLRRLGSLLDAYNYKAVRQLLSQ